MKRKYLSALLMGTLTVASMSTFTSCKDYDDDISNLQGQIDKLATADQLSQKVAELQALISSNKSDITSLQSELAKKTTLDEVKAVLANYAEKKYVDDADKTLNDAIEALKTGDIAQLKKDVQAAADAAKKAADDATAANAEIQETLKTLATKAEVEEVEKAAKAANDAIEALKTGDIKTLQDKQAEILESLKTYAKQESLDKVAEKAEALQTAVAKKADTEALTKAEKDLNDAIAAVKTTAGKNAAAIEGLATTVKNAKDALALAQANQTKLTEALESLKDSSKEGTVAATIKAIQAQIGTPDNKLGSLASRLAVIESTLNGAKDDDTKLGLSTKIRNIENKLKDIIGQYSTMVTDVQLFNFAPGTNQYGTATFNNRTLKFIQTEEQDNVFPADAKVANKQLTFQKGKYYAGEDSLLVRVSPVDAELTTSNVSLMNSQGKELDEIIDVTNVHRYNGLISRATSSNTGLWVVRFKAKDLGDNFKEAAMVDPKDENSKKILYAVAIKNTYNTTDKDEDAKTRRVTSEFGVDLNTETAEHVWDFNVDGTSVAEIHNRYKSCENGTDATLTPTTSVKELVWKMKDGKFVTATNVIEKGDKANVENRPDSYSDADKDNRQDKAILAVAKGKAIEIDFSNATKAGVKGFYVTLDEKYALESSPSELNAWNSYTYKGVGYKKNGTTEVPATLFEGGKGEITIENLGNVQGDVIGFRVYAVNYDGTLSDPDGRSFYVAVGDVQGVKDLGNSDLTLNGTAAGSKFESTAALSADLRNIDFDGFTGWKVTTKDASGETPQNFTVKYYNEKGKELNITSPNKDVVSVKFILNDAQDFIDGAIYKVTTTLTKKISTATSKVCVLNASFKKVMPTSAPTFSYRDGFKSNPEYIVPMNNRAVKDYAILYDNNGKMVNKSGYFDLRNILIINNNQSWNGVDLFDEANTGMFQFNIANGQYGTDGKLATASASGPNYVMNVDNSGKNLVDNTTEHTIAAVYNYKDISKKYDETIKKYRKFTDYPVDSKSTEKIVYCSWMKTFSYDVKSNILVVEEPQDVRVFNEQTGQYETKKKLVKVSKELNTWLNTNTVEWKSDGKGGKTLNFSDLAVSIADYNLLPVTKGLTGKTINKFFESEVIAIVGNVYTTSNDGKQINPYFSASVAGDGSGITLTQISQQAIPSSVTGGKIHFTISDCFGNTKAVELPFKINVKAVTAKKH